MRRVAVLFVALTCGPTLAFAAPDSTAPTFDIQLFHAAPGANNFITTESGDVNSHLSLSVGLSLNYARNPLAIKLLKDDGTEEDIGHVVKNRLDANLLLAFGLFDIFDVGVAVPFVYQGGFDRAAFEGAQIDPGIAPKDVTQGDIRVVPKIRFLNLADGLLSMALVGTVIVPSANGAPYAGENNLVLAPSLAVSTRTELLRVGLNVGYRYRDRTEVQTLIIDDEVFAKLAVALNLNARGARPMEVVGEVFGHTPADNAFALKSTGDAKEFQRSRTTLEGNLGLRANVLDNLILTVGGGGGLLPGYGAPVPRVYLGLMYFTGQSGLVDSDKDGVPDASDQCPDKKEDRDGYKDDDGCPDLDNDNDGIPDEDDQCPMEPEGPRDGFRDEDGCPDPDNDNDGIPDELDKCPNDPEDKDGFQDEDGCPDPDNDNDGIADAIDQCPNEPEDKDGFQDSDGCPELDNDGDGLPDLVDLCPNNPEDFDGVADDDGCAEDNDGDGIPDELDKCPNEPETYNGIEDEDGCPERLKVKSLVNVTDEKIEIKEKIFFKTGSAVIMPKSFGLLDQVASVLKNYKTIGKIRIEGHTDSAGSRKVNLKLSRDRAESVRKYLMDKGIDAGRMEAEGFGPDKPIASNKTAKGKEQNRRVEFVIVEKKPVGIDLTEPEPTAPTPPPAPEAPPAPAPAPAPDKKVEEPMFELDLGDTPAAPKKEDKKKGKKGKKDKKQDDDGGVEFNF